MKRKKRNNPGIPILRNRKKVQIRNEYGMTLKELKRDKRKFEAFMTTKKFKNLDEDRQDKIIRNYDQTLRWIRDFPRKRRA